MSLKRVLYIHYLLCYKEDTLGIIVLIDSDSEVNAIKPAYTSKLGFRVYSIDIGAQKIDSTTLEIFGMVMASF